MNNGQGGSNDWGRPFVARDRPPRDPGSTDFTVGLNQPWSVRRAGRRRLGPADVPTPRSKASAEATDPPDDSSPSGQDPPTRTRRQARSVFESHYAQFRDHRAAGRAAGVSERTSRRWKAELTARTKLAKPDGEPAKERTSFVGRTSELASLEALLDEGKRLITLIGPPGIGKTRLAIQAVRRRLQAGADVVFCDLRTAGSPEDLCMELGRALGASGDRSCRLASSVEGLGRLLAARGPCLVVLDNFEPLAETAASLVDHWVREAPEVRFVVTSRRVLRVHGEHLYELGPLSYEEQGDRQPSEAVQLFVERARATEPGFDPEGCGVHVRRLVRRLEGIPLAIELAAAQMRRVSPTELLHELEERPLQLSSTTATSDPRHATLRSAIDSSWRLLKPWDRAALAQVTVFQHGFATPAADRIVDLGEHRDAPPVGEVLAALREASLVQGISDPSTDHRRWDLFEAVREYAAEQLPATAMKDARTRHARYFLEEGERWARQLPTRGGPHARRSLAGEYHNLDAAFREFAADADARGTTDATLPAIRMALVLYEAVKRWMPERAIRPLSRAVGWAESLGAPRDTRVRLHLARSTAYRETDENHLAAPDLAAAAVLAKTEPLLSAEVDCDAAVFDVECGRMADARPKLERALDLAQSCEARRLEGVIRRYLARILAEAYLDPRAFEHHARSVALLEAEGDVCEAALAREAWCVHRFFFQRGDAGKELADELERAEEFRERLDEGKGVAALGLYHQERGQFDEARRLYDKAIQIGWRTQSVHVIAGATLRLGNLFDETGELQAALSTYASAAEMYRGLRHGRLAGLCAIFQAGVLAREDDAAGAIEMLATAREMLSRSDTTGFEELCELQNAQIDLACSRRLDRAGESERAGALRARAADRIKAAKCPHKEASGSAAHLPLAHRSPEARLLLRLFGEQRSLTVWRSGYAFQIAPGPIVSLPRGGVIRRVLALLVEHHSVAPGEPVSGEKILARCWPGERIHPEAGANRVHQVVHRLRRAGLHDALSSTREGYFLDPGVSVVIAEDSHSPRTDE